MRIIRTIGNESLWKREKTLFLCSKRPPYSLYGYIFEWVESLRDSDCVMCCNTSELEAEVAKALVESRIPTVLVVMNKFHEANNVQFDMALQEGRLLIVILFWNGMNRRKWE